MPGRARKPGKAAGQDTESHRQELLMKLKREEEGRMRDWRERPGGEGRTGAGGVVMLVVLHQGEP